MDLQEIDTGTGPNTQTGDPARTWAEKSNANFQYLENKIDLFAATVSVYHDPEYANLAAMYAGQASQTTTKIIIVNDASDDPTVDSGAAFYQYLGTLVGNLQDYRKLSDEEVSVLAQNSQYNKLAVKEISTGNIVDTGVDGISFKHVSNLVTEIIFSAKFSIYVDTFKARATAGDSFEIHLYNVTNTALMVADITLFEYTDGTNTYYKATVENVINIGDLNTTDELIVNILPKGTETSVGSVIDKTGTTITFIDKKALWNRVTPLDTGDLTIDLTGAVQDSKSIVYADRYVPVINGDYYVIDEKIPLADKFNLISFWYDNSIVHVEAFYEEYLPTVSGLSVTEGDTEVILDFNTVAIAESYNIYTNSTNDFSTATLYQNVLTNTSTITGLTNGVEIHIWAVGIAKGYRPGLESYITATPIAPAVANTFVGGIGVTYPNASAFATRLSITDANILDYVVDINNDISCTITTPYELSDDAFFENEDIKFYYDPSGLCTKIGNRCFHILNGLGQVSAFTDFDFPGVLEANTLAFYRSAVTDITLNACTVVGNEFAGYCADLTSLTMNALLNAKVTFLTECVSLSSVDMALCETLGDAAFQDVDSLVNLSLPSLLTLTRRSVYNNALLETFVAPNLTSITGTERQLARNPLVKEYDLRNVTSISGTHTFEDCFGVELINIRSCTVLGDTVGDNNIFDSIKTGCVIIADPVLQTNNGGGQDGDLAYAETTRSAIIVFSLNFTAPDAITDLTLGTVYGSAMEVSWTAPTTTNVIIHYNLYVDGVKVKKELGLNTTIIDLQLATSYDITVTAVDEYYNESLPSNVITQSTNVSYDTANQVSSWTFAGDNSDDDVGTNNGVDTAVSYVADPTYGKLADFTAGTSSVITVADSDSLSFPGLPFTGATVVRFNTAVNASFFTKMSTSQAGEYTFRYVGGFLEFLRIDVSQANARLTTRTPFVPIAGGTYHFGFVDRGLDDNTSVDLYINNVKQEITTTTQGTYIQMENTTDSFLMGKRTDTVISLNGYMAKPVIFNAAKNEGQFSDIYHQSLA